MSHDSFQNWDWRIKIINECPSTNTELRRLIEDGEAAAGEVLITDRQPAGRGRFKRTWSSPPGNLAMSAAVPVYDPAKAYQHGLVAGLALAETINRLSNLASKVKWPNDVLIGKGKIAGILSELAIHPDETKPVAIIGIGLNFNSTRADFPEELRDRIVTLRDAAPSRVWERDAFLTAFLRQWRERLRHHAEGGIAALLTDIHAHLAWKHEPVSIREDGSPPFTGVIESLDADGFLLVRTSDGTLRRVVAADLKLMP